MRTRVVVFFCCPPPTPTGADNVGLYQSAPDEEGGLGLGGRGLSPCVVASSLR